MDKLSEIIQFSKNEQEVLEFVENMRYYQTLDETGGNYLHVSCTYFKEYSLDSERYVTKDNDALIEKLIKKGVDVNGRDNMLRTPLHCFCIYFDNWIKNRWGKCGDVKNIYFPYRLLEAGADVNATDIYGRTPIYYCRDINIAEYLYSKGAKLEIKDIYGMTPIFTCNSVEMLDFYTKYNCGLNEVDVWGRNALAECSGRVREKLLNEFNLQELQENDRDVSLFPGTYSYESKMEKLDGEKNYIINYRNHILKNVLCDNKSDDYDECDDFRWKAPVMAYGSFEETVLRLRDEIPWEERQEDAEKALLTQVEEFTAKEIGYDGCQPYFGNSKTAYVNERIKVIQVLIDILIEEEADLNYADMNGQTAIFHCKRPQYLMLLLSYGARLSVRDKNGNTPLWVYATNNPGRKIDEEDSLEIIRILLEKGFNPNERDKYGRPLLTELRSSDNYRYASRVRDLLIRYGADTESESEYEKQVKSTLKKFRMMCEDRNSYSDDDLADYYGYDSDLYDEDEYSKTQFLDDL